jgi:hypothetical protein
MTVRGRGIDEGVGEASGPASSGGPGMSRPPDFPR